MLPATEFEKPLAECAGVRQPKLIAARLEELQERERLGLLESVKRIDEDVEDIRATLRLVALNDPRHGRL